jgi:hypothetical protein
MPTSFIWIIVFFDRPFEYGDGGVFKLLRCKQNVHQSTWDHKILYANTFRGWTAFNNNTFARIQRYKHGGRLKVKIHVVFYEGYSWTVALMLDKWNFVHWKTMDIQVLF